jgi:hypothetical protein
VWLNGQTIGLSATASTKIIEPNIREVTSRIDKDLKVELRQTAFDMWMACYSQQEIAEAVGYSKDSISEFVKNLQLSEIGTDAAIRQPSEKPILSKNEGREFDEDEEEDSNSLGVYKLDKRLLIKANHQVEEND